MNWGKSIVLVFIVFAGFIGTLVVLMTRQKVDLVREDYYQNELVYQRQIDRVARTMRLGKSIDMTYQAAQHRIAVVLPDSFQTGEVTFYRPSDRQQDVRIRLIPSPEGVQFLPTAKLAKGYWKVEFTWSDGRLEYYTGKDFFVQKNRSFNR